MRTITVDEITVKYADSIGYAFMPCLLSAQGSSLKGIELTLNMNGNSYTAHADAYDGSVIVDYREYIQAFFDSVKFGEIDYKQNYHKSELGATVTITASAVKTDGSTVQVLSAETFYVWGSVRTGETWSDYRRLRWFKNYPFSFGVYADSATKALIGFNGAPRVTINLNAKGMYELTSNLLDKNAEYSVIYRYDGEIKQATFSNYFDLTFFLKAGEQSTLLRIDFDNATDGIYLRWVDRHGFYRYWLFTQGDEERAVSSESSFIRNNLGAYDDTYGYYGANGRRQSYEREDTVALCAPLVDSDTFDMLQDLASSPVVDMYMGNGRWQSVTIKTGSYSKTTAVLQDFVCSMVINDINIQQL